MELTESSEMGVRSTSEARRRGRYFALALGAAAFLLVIAITSGAGPGLDPDAMAYVGAATSFAHHGTLRVQSSSWDAEDSTSSLTGWPPGFPIAMAIPQYLGVSPMSSARIVMATAAFIAAAVLFVLLESAVGSGAAVASVVAILLTPAFAGVHMSVLSEPLFLASLVATLFGMTRPPRRPLATGIPAAVAAITRYAGVCVPMAVVLWFFFVDRKPLRQRFGHAAKAAAIPAIVIGAWVVRSARVSDGEGGAHLALNGKWGPTLRQGASTIADWLAPAIVESDGRAVIAVALAAGIAIVIARALRDVETSKAFDLFKATAVLLGCYVVVLLSARLLIGDGIPFDFRILFPIIVLLEILIAISAAVVLQRSAKTFRLGALAVLALWLAGSALATGQNAFRAISDGSDFASSDWRDSPTLAWVRSRGAGWSLFTNWPAAVYFRTSRVARDVPQSLAGAELNEFHGILNKDHGAFVAFATYNTDYPPSDSIARKMGLVELARFSDGTVWVTKESRPR